MATTRFKSLGINRIKIPAIKATTGERTCKLICMENSLHNQFDDAPGLLIKPRGGLGGALKLRRQAYASLTDRPEGQSK
jgi:hypothetical protein